MKVCDVVLNSIWYDPRVRKQIIEYKNQGVEVSCVGYRCNRFDEEQIKKIPVPVSVVSIDPKYDGKQKGIIRKLVRERKKNQVVEEAILAYAPDVIHANDLNALIPAYAASKKLKCRLVYDSHEINSDNYTGKKNRLLGAYYRAMESRLVHKVDLMISVSHAAADYFAQEYHIRKPMVITNCALASENVSQPVEKNAGFEVLNHGGFYAGRGYDLMIEAAPLLKEYPEIKLALRGFGKIENQLHNRAEELNAENVVFYPKVKVEELIPLAAGSMVGVAITEPICLNFKLSISNKIFEYAAAGLPVIMSDIPEHRYLNEKYGIGVILKENTPACFAQAVKKMYGDREFYDACAKGSRRMSDEVNWENEFSKLIEIERSLCGEN
ncbi:MAG: glycosyltransferase [Thermoguttaceae bacterium]